MKEKNIKHIGGKTVILGTSSIRHSRITYYEDGSKDVEEVNIPLTNITAEECTKKRLNLVPGIIVKENNIFYFAEIPKKGFACSSTKKEVEHLCFDCMFAYAKDPKEGGCKKVQDIFSHGNWNKLSCMIEKYDFIQSGYEQINTQKECFFVFKCSNFQRAFHTKQKSKAELRKLKKGLKSYLYE